MILLGRIPLCCVTYTYAVTLFRQLGYIYLSKSSDIPCTYPHRISKGYQDIVNIFLYKRPNIQTNCVRARFLVDNFCSFFSVIATHSVGTLTHRCDQDNDEPCSSLGQMHYKYNTVQGQDCGVELHFQQYFSYIMVVSFIGFPGENHQPAQVTN